MSFTTVHRYYTGAKVAPVLTLVIGGNHEASNYMWELYVSRLSLVVSRVYSSQVSRWLALSEYILLGERWLRPGKRCSYRGHVWYIQQTSLSPRYQPHHVSTSAWLNPPLGFHEKMPYSYGSMRSIYHIREYNFRRLALVHLPGFVAFAAHLTTYDFSSRNRTSFSHMTGRRLSNTTEILGICCDGNLSSRMISGTVHLGRPLCSNS